MQDKVHQRECSWGLKEDSLVNLAIRSETCTWGGVGSVRRRVTGLNILR
jgi:hypothetical protein